MFHQPTDEKVNGSCQGPTSACNKSAGGDALQLPTFSTAAKARVIITFSLCAVSAVCNLVVLWAASNGGRRKSHVRILIMNLTVADLLVTFIVMPVDAAWNITVQWQAGDVACRLLMFLKLVAMYSCAFVTVVISLDRQSAILNPLGISEAKRKSKIMLTVAWTMSVILSLPQVGENIFYVVPFWGFPYSLHPSLYSDLLAAPLLCLPSRKQPLRVKHKFCQATKQSVVIQSKTKTIHQFLNSIQDWKIKQKLSHD